MSDRCRYTGSNRRGEGPGMVRRGWRERGDRLGVRALLMSSLTQLRFHCSSTSVHHHSCEATTPRRRSGEGRCTELLDGLPVLNLWRELGDGVRFEVELDGLAPAAHAHGQPNQLVVLGDEAPSVC